eukprot:COSAG02_NODE_5189_length_4555_cov_10.704668_1_plen_405_part_00
MCLLTCLRSAHAGDRECDEAGPWETCRSATGTSSTIGSCMHEKPSVSMTMMVMGSSSYSVEARIRDGSSIGVSRGVLEMNIDGAGWDAVCDDGFGSDEAETFCIALGFSGGSTYDTTHGDSGFAADDINCPSGSTSLSQCSSSRAPYTDNCGDSETVGIDCSSSCSTGQYVSGSTCESCPLGRYMEETSHTFTSCTLCGAGKFLPTVGGTSASDCIQCAIGTYDASDRSACNSCAAGQTSAAGSTSASSCFACSSGQYVFESTCNSCATGKHRSDVSHTFTSCVTCVAGQFAEVTGQASCYDCVVAQYQGDAGQTSCASCAAGQVQPNTGQAACIDCDGGQYQGSSGQTACILCLVGETSSSGASSCNAVECSSGTYLSGNTWCATAACFVSLCSVDSVLVPLR